MVYEAIRELVRYGLEKGLITEDDAIYARNQILEALKMDEYEEMLFENRLRNSVGSDVFVCILPFGL